MDVTVNQANLQINRNAGMTNGNIVMGGGGGGGVIRHAGSLDIYPSFASNAGNAFRFSFDGTNTIFTTLGSAAIRMGKNLQLGPNQLVFGTNNDANLYRSGAGRLQTDGAMTVNTGLRYTNPTAPSSATAPGVKGDIAYDSNYIYICVATNTWKRANLTTW